MVSPSFEALGLERAGHVVTITLNRPEKLNALDPRLTDELHSALDAIAAEMEVRAVILTGMGRGFCSGADVNQQMASLEGQWAPTPARGIMELAPRLRRMPQPVIAAVNGVAAGAGLALALACDIRIASEAARFSCIFVKRSLVPDTGSSYTLPRLVGDGIAREMALTGNIYDARWALEKGLVNTVVPADRLLEEAMAMANDIAANPPHMRPLHQAAPQPARRRAGGHPAPGERRQRSFRRQRRPAGGRTGLPGEAPARVQRQVGASTPSSFSSPGRGDLG